MNHNPRSRIILEELRGDRLIHTSSIPISQEEAPQDRVIDIPLPRCNGRNVVSQTDTEMQCADTINMLVPKLGHDDVAQGSELAQQFIPDTQT